MSSERGPDAGVRTAIAGLVAEYVWLIDHGAADRVASLFTEEGRLLGLGEDIVGRAAIAAWGERRAAMRERTTRHVCTNLRLTHESPGRVRGTVLLTVYRHDGPPPRPATPFMVGDFEDIYERGQDGSWRIAERRLVPAFSG